MTSSIAFSSPKRYSSGPGTIVIGMSPATPACCMSTRAAVSRSISRVNVPLTPMKAASAPMTKAATASPSTIWYGLARMMARSLKVAGSPSAPLATTNLRSPGEPAARTPLHFRPVGKPPPPRPRRPASPISLIVWAGPSCWARAKPVHPPSAFQASRDSTGESGRRNGGSGRTPGDYPGPEEVSNVGRRQRPGVVVALGLAAAQPAQHGRLQRRFDAFGDHAHAQGVSQPDHGRDDRGVVGVVAEAGHERLVDLEDVDREPLQVAERRI